MCGIAGWADFDRDLTGEVGVLRKMVDTMALRGPDDEGLWVRRHVALGHRRLSVIDLDGGAQPMVTPETLPDGTPLAAISYSGEVYNFGELRDELELRGHRFRTRSDTEVVLRAYLEWGPGFVARLNGMFAFAIWDSRAEELLLYRDRLGIKPLFYYPLRSGVLFGSEPKAVLAHPESRAVLSLDGLRDVLSFLRVPGQTPLDGLYEVRPGHVLRVRAGRRVEERYWELQAWPHTDDVPTSVDTVRGLLDDIVPRQMVADVPLCTLLSGGLDSSALTALAQGALNTGRGGRIRSFSVDFAGHVENFEPEVFREAPDAPFAAELVEHVGTEHREILLDNAKLASSSVRAAAWDAWDLPYGIGDHGPSLYLLFQAVRGESTVALSGESADEVFGGYLWFHDRRAVEADTFPWHALGERPVTEEATAFLHEDLVAELRLAEYIDDQYRTAVAEVPHLASESPHEHRMRVASYLNLTRFLPIMLDRKDRMSMANGLEVRVPFCDHRLVEYVFNAPWSVKTFDGREKSLLRAATEDLLPRSITERRKAPYPSTQDSGYDRMIKQELGAVVADPDAPGLPLFDLDAIHAHLAAPVKRSPSMIERALRDETPVRLNAWLDSYRVGLGW
ncbi:asparagine synthase (glutamine-hydrolyzing) [Amycolatopsis sp. 195334CR]|uniref:asparagine synthase (glutamine-hydrolyzing) n=1 Tax=Amycolatopsis sp. 195334CR TaxID=2814588 RepID=UPI001A8FE936|nr:asparagine synthase (glutamine-hydrolyzing) [Amycolatopsis sp. 195334CR]MBN6039895.1 asparagine synthase (glutamine-hydrolyzing) [Amycolatopsis sp. 195334CR]